MEVIKGGLEENLRKKNEILERKIALYKENFLKHFLIGDNKRAAYYGIMYFYKYDHNKLKTNEEIKDAISMNILTNEAIKELTFRDIMEIFPILKDYDGEKYDFKDYFSTIEYLKAVNIDEKIGDDLYDFFWEYASNPIMGYGAKSFILFGKLDEIEGREHMVKKFLRESGVTTYTIDEKKEKVIDNTTGKVVPFKPVKTSRKNSNLRIIVDNTKDKK